MKTGNAPRPAGRWIKTLAGYRAFHPSDRESEREVARSEHHDGAERLQHPSQVGTRQRLTIGQGGIDACVHPRAFAHDLSEEPELPARAASLAGDARKWQAGLGASALEKLVTDGFYLAGDLVEKAGAYRSRSDAIVCEDLAGGVERAGNLDGRRFVKIRCEALAGGAVDGAKDFAAALARYAGDETETTNGHIRRRG